MLISPPYLAIESSRERDSLVRLLLLSFYFLFLMWVALVHACLILRPGVFSSEWGSPKEYRKPMSKEECGLFAYPAVAWDGQLHSFSGFVVV